MKTGIVLLVDTEIGYFVSREEIDKAFGRQVPEKRSLRVIRKPGISHPSYEEVVDEPAHRVFDLDGKTYHDPRHLLEAFADKHGFDCEDVDEATGVYAISIRLSYEDRNASNLSGLACEIGAGFSLDVIERKKAEIARLRDVVKAFKPEPGNAEIINTCRIS